MISSQMQQRKNKRLQKIKGLKLSIADSPVFKHQHALKISHKKSIQTAASLSTQQTSRLEKQSFKEEDLVVIKPKALQCFADLYTLGQKIGEGAHGIVKKCTLKGQEQIFAVKTIRLDMEHILFLKENFTQIKKLNHKNIIGYKALFLEQKKEQCHLVMEYLPYPDLLGITIKDEQQLQEIVYQILSTLAYIHSQNICHRDIKPENILYDEKSRNIKIIDFGISKKLTKRNIKKDMLTQTGTLYYRAPEMFEGGGYDERVDLWALGATIFKLMTGSTPFESVYLNETITNIMKGEFSFPQKMEQLYSKSSRNLVARLLKKKEERLTAQQALLDVWLMDLYQNADELTRSLTPHKALRIFGQAYINIVPIFRTNTNNKKSGTESSKQIEESPEQIIKRLKLSDIWKEQESNIYQGQDLCSQIQF